MSTSSSFTWSDITSISAAPSTFKYSTSSAERSIDDETRTLRSETRSMGKESTPSSYSISFTNRSSRSSIEKSISNSSFMSDVYTGPVCLTKGYDHNMSFADCYKTHPLAMVLKQCSRHTCQFCLTQKMSNNMQKKDLIVCINVIIRLLYLLIIFSRHGCGCRGNTD